MGVVVRRYIDILTIIINFPYSTCISSFLAAASLLLCSFLKCFFGLVYVILLQYISKHYSKNIIESVDSINRDERSFPLMQYITNGGISRARNTITHFKHHHRVLRLISNRMSV